MAKVTQRAEIFPVHVLRERCTELEATLALVLVKPRRKPVHQLRTGVRRVEAQLQLLSLLARLEPALRTTRELSKRVRRLLAQVREAAGRVRDFDVQREMILGVLEEDAPKRTRNDARNLRRALKDERAAAADDLLAELQGHARKLGPKLEKMLRSLEPVWELKIASSRVTELVRQWYMAQTAGEDGSEKKLAKLHGIRKAAKLARYMVECVGDAALTAEYENIQNIGGGWHDSLTLRQTAHDHLGKRSKLVRIFAGQEDAMLAQFRVTLRAKSAGGERIR